MGLVYEACVYMAMVDNSAVAVFCICRCYDIGHICFVCGGRLSAQAHYAMVMCYRASERFMLMP